MSIEDLKADLADNMAEAKALGTSITTSVQDIVKHLNNSFWPFVENVVTEMEDLDEGLSDLYHGAEDILQPDTAKLFAGVITGGAILVTELERRLTAADGKLKEAIAEWRELADQAGAALEEIVVPEAEGDDEDEDEADNDNQEQT